MIWLHLLFAYFVGLPMALFFAYAVGIQYQRESLPLPVRGLCAVVAAMGLVIDVLANWTVLSVYLLELPLIPSQWANIEWTFSTRLERLVTEQGWRSRIAWPIARLLNWLAPPGKPHIHNAGKAAAT